MTEHSSKLETEEANITSVRDKIILIITDKVTENALPFTAKLSDNLIKYNQMLGGKPTVLENYQCERS